MMLCNNHLKRRAASLLEVAMASLMVGVLLIGALNSVGARLRHQAELTERQRANLLAEQLLAEVLEHRYQDPDESPTFGPEPTETGGTRAPFDDVDDFDGWDKTPIEARNGIAMANATGWRRTIDVEYVPANDMTATSGGDQGIKRITVAVYVDGQLVATRVGFRSSAWEDAHATY